MRAGVSNRIPRSETSQNGKDWKDGKDGGRLREEGKNIHQTFLETGTDGKEISGRIPYTEPSTRSTFCPTNRIPHATNSRGEELSSLATRDEKRGI